MTIRWKIAQYFESWWWKNYLSGQSVETYLAWKKNYWTTFLVNQQIVLSETDKIMDAGCGPAGIFTILKQKEVTAVDPLLVKYENELAHFQKKDYPNVRFVKKGIEEIKSENSFDKIFCLNAINHVNHLNLSIKNLIGALKENGVLYLSVDAHNYEILKKIFQIIPGDILHPHQMNLKGYKNKLIKNNATIKKISLIKKEPIFNYYLITATKNQLTPNN